MKGALKARLQVNKISIEMNPFVEGFLAHIAVGVVASLKGAESVQHLEIRQEKGNVKISVNGRDVPLTPFPNDIICSTLTGLVSSLKEVTDIESLDISVDVH
ncbi:MAG: hypothetical protein AAGB97_04600 [Dehalococcoidia bacterium]|nr:hypothetical protein [Chloroflexota bacterium]MBT9159272.1 hypothetical protein [Chloroflexota bacterium]MBT9161909.1 hypothetical protein [Chloroflexota bacterium]